MKRNGAKCAEGTAGPGRPWRPSSHAPACPSRGRATEVPGAHVTQCAGGVGVHETNSSFVSDLDGSFISGF